MEGQARQSLHRQMQMTVQNITNRNYITNLTKNSETYRAFPKIFLKSSLFKYFIPHVFVNKIIFIDLL
jgi:hypothetical protein